MGLQRLWRRSRGGGTDGDSLRKRADAELAQENFVKAAPLLRELAQSGDIEAAFQLGDYGETLAKHWAATMFARHPKAVRVDVDFEQYDPPSMADYRAGKRAQWQTTYTQFFCRKDMLTTPEKGATP